MKIFSGIGVRRSGFTLLEILMAVSILVILVFIVGGMFRHSTGAWEAGLRRTESDAGSRAALSMMAHELSMAVADTRLKCSIVSGMSDISFYTFGPIAGNREVRKVTYTLDSGSLKRKLEEINIGSGYPTPISSSTVSLLDNVTDLKFRTGVLPCTTNLPPWVDIEMTVQDNITYSVVHTKSAGPDRAWGTLDDVSSTNQVVH